MCASRLNSTKFNQTDTSSSNPNKDVQFCQQFGMSDVHSCFGSICMAVGVSFMAGGPLCDGLGPLLPACYVGLGILGIGTSAACFLGGHLDDHPLPSIALELRNGSIVDVDGKSVHTITLKGYQSKSLPQLDILSSILATDAQSTLILGDLKPDVNIITAMGLAAGGVSDCTDIDQQICIPGLYAILTCTKGKKWTVRQTCGRHSQCRKHPFNEKRILCTL